MVTAIIEKEGGYSDHPDDSGGKTCWGITEALARKHGYVGEMRNLTKIRAMDIYKAEFWNPMRLDEVDALSPDIAQEMFDTAVNCGVPVAAGFLQRSLNVFNQKGTLYPDIKVDALVGPATLNALSAFLGHRGTKGNLVMMRSLNSLQGAFYLSLAERREKDESFVFGWMLNRVGV